MSQLDLIPMTETEKAIPGAQWWAGEYQCRNFGGYYQVRERGRGAWQFVIYGFGCDDTTACIYRIEKDGSLVHEDVPIDDRDRLRVNGRKYGRDNWRH